MNESLAPADGVLRWEHFPHGSDVGVRGWGSTPAAAFEQAAVALTAAVTSARVEASEPVEVSCQAPDLELLLVEWLNSVIYEMAVRRMLFARFSVRIEGRSLKELSVASRSTSPGTLRPASRRAQPTRR